LDGHITRCTPVDGNKRACRCTGHHAGFEGVTCAESDQQHVPLFIFRSQPNIASADEKDSDAEAERKKMTAEAVIKKQPQ
jgi:hypothetical protein